jgi:hypothetical protein
MWDKKDIITKKIFFEVAAVSDTGKGLENIWNIRGWHQDIFI